MFQDRILEQIENIAKGRKTVRPKRFDRGNSSGAAAARAALRSALALLFELGGLNYRGENHSKTDVCGCALNGCRRWRRGGGHLRGCFNRFRRHLWRRAMVRGRGRRRRQRQLGLRIRFGPTMRTEYPGRQPRLLQPQSLLAGLGRASRRRASLASKTSRRAIIASCNKCESQGA